MKVKDFQRLLTNAEILGAKLKNFKYSDYAIKEVTKSYLKDNGIIITKDSDLNWMCSRANKRSGDPNILALRVE